MRIVVISDTHGNVEGASLILSTVAAVDLVVHLGDHIADIWALAADLPCPVVGVLGNEDRAEPGPSELVIPAAGLELLAIHGHLFDLNPYLPKEAWEERMDGLVRGGRAQRRGGRPLRPHPPAAPRRAGRNPAGQSRRYLPRRRALVPCRRDGDRRRRHRRDPPVRPQVQPGGALQNTVIITSGAKRRLPQGRISPNTVELNCHCDEPKATWQSPCIR